MTVAHLNHIATAVPEYDVHAKFVAFAPERLPDERQRRLFRRMAYRAQIGHRYSFVEPHPSPSELDRVGLFARSAFADTTTHMRFFAAQAVRFASWLLARIAAGTQLDRRELDPSLRPSS